MPLKTHPRSTLSARLRITLLALSVTGLLAAMPLAASANASPVTPAAVSISDGELGTIKLNALGLESSELATVLARIPALGALPAGSLATIAAELPASSTLQELLSAIKTKTGVEVSAGEATQVLVGDGAANPAVLANVLSDAASLLNGTPQAGKLDEVLTAVIGGLSPTALTQLQTALGSSGTPTELAATLEGKLAKGELVPALTTALGELGTTAATTGAQAATLAGTTPSALAGELGLTESALGTASGTSTRLGSLEGFLNVLGNPSGLTLGVVPGASTSAPGGSSTTNSSTTTGPSTTSTNVYPGPASAPATSAAKPAKVQIVSHKIKGRWLILRVKVPSAGQLSVTGAHAKRENLKASKASLLTVKVPLAQAVMAAMHRHHRMKLPIKVLFKPTHGSASSATTLVAVR